MNNPRTIIDLIPQNTVNNLLDLFTNMTQVAAAVFDLNGELLSKPSNYTRHCKDFIHSREEGQEACHRMASDLVHKALETGDYACGTCPFLLHDCKIPIRVNGRVLGFVGIGQVFVEPPDREQHRKIAQRFGFEEEAFWEAVCEIPVLTRAQFAERIEFLRFLVQTLVVLGEEAEQFRNQSRKLFELFQQIFEHAPLGINMLTPDLDIININRFTEERLGMRREQVVGKKCYEVVGQYRDDPTRCAEEKICDNCPSMRSLRSGTIETTVREIPTGAVMEVSAVPIRNESGQISMVLEIIRDVSEERKLYEQLQRSRNYLNSVLNNMNDGLMVVDPDYRVVDVNQRFLDTYGIKRHEAIGAPCYRLTQRLDQPCHALGRACPAKEVFSTGRHVTAEVEHIDKTGQKAFLEISASPLKNQERQVQYVIEVARDVTQRKRDEERIKQSEAFFRVLFERSPDAIHILDKEGRIIDCNQAEADLLGYPRSELVGKHVSDLLTPESRRKFAVAFSRFKKEGYLEAERDCVCKDGRIITCWLRATALYDQQGQLWRVIVMLRDITQQKLKEKQIRQMQKLEALGTLAGGIAHDFNNILAVILGYAELMDVALPTSDLEREYVHEILAASTRAKDLVRQILSFARHTEHAKTDVQLGSLVKEIIKFLRASIPTTIEIRQKILDDRGIILADPTQIHQVLMNLCTNAAHAMREKGGVLEIGVRHVRVDPAGVDPITEKPRFSYGYRDLMPGPYVELTVRDTGCGIEPALLERIFDPYFTTKERGKGTGLGLAVVHGIVADHGGAVVVESVVGEGTTFYVYLPRRKDGENGSEKVHDSSLPAGADEHILLLDDEPMVLQMARRMLEQLGYRVTEESDSVRALEKFREHPEQYDLVITDMTMPHMTGDQFARALMAVRSDIPVILCTGFSERIDKTKARELGIRAFIQKPLKLKNFARVVRNVLDGEPSS